MTLIQRLYEILDLVGSLEVVDQNNVEVREAAYNKLTALIAEQDEGN
jgi:hypothetical protein